MKKSGLAFDAFIVGGAVRDRLLNFPVQDRDWVVVGASPETMLAAGFKPVGKDFPVFLHPQTQEEYALARTERKTAPGYKGFPARCPEFSVAPETLVLMRDMVVSGEVDHLVPERVWQEISRGLMYERPSRMIEVLRDCGALARILPELNELFGVPQPRHYHPEVDTGVHILKAIDYAAKQQEPLPVRWAVLLHDLGKGLSPREDWPHHYGHEERGLVLVEAVCARLKVPTDCRDLALMTCREHGNVHKVSEMRAATLASFLERLDVLRRPARFEAFLAAADCDVHGRENSESQVFPALALLRRACAAFSGVDAGAVARAVRDKAQIPACLHAARTDAIRQALSLEADGLA